MSLIMEGLKKAQQLRLNTAPIIRVNEAYSKPHQRRISAQKGRWIFVGSSLAGFLLFLFFMGASFSPSNTDASKQAPPSPETTRSIPPGVGEDHQTSVGISPASQEKITGPLKD